MTEKNDSPRVALLAGSVTGETERAAQVTEKRFSDFRHRLGLREDAVAVILYLTWIRDEGASSRQVSKQLEYLDLVGRFAGRPPWRAMPEIRGYLRGLFREQGIGATMPQSDPLYRDQVEVLINAIMSPTGIQLRARAAALLANEMELDRSDICALQWKHIRFGRDHVVVTPSRRRSSVGWREVQPKRIDSQGGALCVVNALRRWHERGATPAQPIFLTRGHKCPIGVATALRDLAITGDVADTVRRATQSPVQMRDRLAILLGYGAALSPLEAVGLRLGHISVAPEGLLVSVPGRSQVSGIPAHPGAPGDIVAAWAAWLDFVHERGSDDPDHPALMQVTGGRPVTKELATSMLQRMVQRAVTRAEMTGGRYTYESLRWGMIRTALRADEPLYSVAQRASMRLLSSVLVHHHREHLVTRSVAGQLGL